MRRAIHRPAARADIRNLLESSRRQFGAQAQHRYKALIDRAILLLCENPLRPGARQRADLPDGVHLFHLRHARERGQTPKQPRHFIAFTFDERTLTILRVLHETMDIADRTRDPGKDDT